MGRPWTGYDLDGTIAYFDHHSGIGTIGEPIPSMVEHLKASLAKGEVRIVTARVAHGDDPRLKDFIAHQRSMIEQWCLLHIGQVLKVTSEKDFDMVRLFDDRASEVITNRGIIVGFSPA
jgi:hypothetical protein